MAVLFIIAIIFAAFLAEAAIIMVVWGALALTFGFSTIGFGTACLVALALSIVGGFFKTARS